MQADNRYKIIYSTGEIHDKNTVCVVACSCNHMNIISHWKWMKRGRVECEECGAYLEWGTFEVYDNASK